MTGHFRERTLQQSTNPEAETMMGININDKTADYTGMIVAGVKTVETRRTRSLDSVVGKRVGIVRTGVGKATLVGYATIGEPVWYADGAEWAAARGDHRVPAGSDHDAPDGGKWGYPLLCVEPADHKVVLSRGIVLRKID